MIPLEDTKICMIEIPNSGLDNDYTFYESGRIYHFYDRHTYPGGQNREEWIVVKDISEQVKQRLLDKCLPEHLKKITEILAH